MKEFLRTDDTLGRPPGTAAPPAPSGRARLTRFAAVGASGIVVNLGVLYLLAAVLRAPELASSALAIEASIVWNFLWHDSVTFRDRRAAARAGAVGRLVRYNAVSLVGFALQLGTFAIAALVLTRALHRPALGNLRYVAQGAGIALAFAWNFLGSFRFAWGVHGERTIPRLASPEDPEDASRPARIRWLAPALFWALLGLHVVPIWIVHYFPTQDGPLHVENVLALMRWSRSPLLQHWYDANWGAQPNWLTQALLAGLLQVSSPVLAEKIVLTGAVLLLPLGFRAVLPRGSRGWWASLAAFPFVYSFPFHMGFWNFCYGLGLVFIAVAFWDRTRGKLSPARGVVLALLACLLYVAHSVAFAGAMVMVAALLLWRASAAIARTREHPARRRIVVRGYAARVGGAVLVALPGIALLAAWLFAHRDRAEARIPFAELAAKLATMYALVSIDRREILFAAAVSFVLAIAAVHALLTRATRSTRPNDGWLVAAIAFAVLYFAVPDVVASGAHISDRLALLAALSLVAWIGTGAAPRATVRRLGIALSVVAVGALAVRAAKHRALSAYMEEYVTASAAVRPGSTLLPLALSPHGPRDAEGRRMGYRVKPFLHGAGWIVAERGGVDLDNSQANTDQCPVRFPDDRNPFKTIAFSLGRMEGMPPCVDLSAGGRGRAIDYVLVWGATREMLDTPCGGALAAELARGYEPVFLSAPRGLLQIWRPRPVTALR